MAETRIIDNAEALFQVLEDCGLFAQVERNAAGTAAVCRDTAGNPVAAAAGCTDLAFYADAEHAFPGASLGTITHAYLCENGVFLTKYYDGLLREIFLLTRTNTGAPALVHLNTADESWNAVTWGDTIPLTEKTMPVCTANQYSLMPFVTNAAVGISSYTPDAFYTAMTPGTQQPRSFLLNRQKWFAVGNAVLREGDAESYTSSC